LINQNKKDFLGVPLQPAYRIYLPEVEVGLPTAGRVGLEFIPIFIGITLHRFLHYMAFAVSNFIKLNRRPNFG
jgi:hypothetical protein